MAILSDIACFVEDKVRSSDIELSYYITTDCILPNKQGRTIAQNLPPQECSLTRYTKSDVLIANIRPYLKKIWYADCEGGCSNDVLVLRVLPNHSSAFLFAALSNDRFFDYVMMGTKGSKMPRGDKDQIMRYKIPMMMTYNEEESIGRMILSIERKIKTNQEINHNLEAMAKQLYDYWFVQFDFPNADGKPYKSSGGKMVWNVKLKRYIPEGWECKNLLDIAIFTNGLACQKYRPTTEAKLPVIKIREMHDGFTTDTEWVKADIPDSVKIFNGDVLFSWSASLEVMLWCFGEGGLNQHIFKVTGKNGFPRSYYYYQLKDYVNVFKAIAEARKTTMGHITQDHLQQSTIAVPPTTELPILLEKKIAPLFEQIITLQEENAHLVKLRDELLPLLMNGQVSVNYDLSAD